MSILSVSKANKGISGFSPFHDTISLSVTTVSFGLGRCISGR